jgi:hypothetical protein
VTEELISLREAARRGVKRVRKPVWAHPFDHVDIDIINGKPGPWLHLWCPFNEECNRRDPVHLFLDSQFVGNIDAPAVLPYEGPPPDSAEYRSEVEKFKGCLKR